MNSINYQQLRQTPIVDVALGLGIDLKRTGNSTYAMVEDREVTSLVIYADTNSWYRHSGKKFGGVSHGSPIDLVMHILDCNLKDAVSFLETYFPLQT